MAFTYSQTTFAQAKDRLASLLGDPSQTFWTNAELGRYLIEALHWWGLTAQYWRDSATLDIVPGQQFYDIRDVVLSDGSFAQSFTVTDREIINDACYQLMETQISNWAAGWPGSEMFELAELSNTLELSQDDLLRQAGCVVEEVVYDVTGGQIRIELDQRTIHIVRASIEELGDDGTGSIYPVWPIDQYQAQGSLDNAGVNSPGRPKAFVLTYTPTLAVDLFPAARTQSRLRLYIVRSGTSLAPEDAATIITLPDDAAWLAKYRMMDDLLSGDGLSRAPEMSAYCRQRWQDGLDALAQYQSLLWSTVDGRRMTVSSLGQLDAQRPDWQNAEGTTRSLHMLSWNLFTTYPQTSDTRTIELELVKKAPIPASDSDFIQVGPEQLQAIYDYATHIAMFKCQGAEMTATFDLYQEAKRAATEHMESLAGTSVNWTLQQRLNRQDRLMRPYRRPNLVANATAGAKNG